jgi:hypothetical protein
MVPVPRYIYLYSTRYGILYPIFIVFHNLYTYFFSEKVVGADTAAATIDGANIMDGTKAGQRFSKRLCVFFRICLLSEWRYFYFS